MSDLFEEERRKPISSRRKVKFPSWKLVELNNPGQEWSDEFLKSNQPFNINWENLLSIVPLECLREYTQGKYLGRGTEADVFQVCKGKDCSKVVRVVKFVEPDPKGEEIEFMKDAEYSFLMGHYRIGPRVFDYWICPKMIHFSSKFVLVPGGMMIIQKMDTTLRNYTTQIKVKIDKLPEREYWYNVLKDELDRAKLQLKEKLILMSKIKYRGETFVHPDIHRTNIMLDVSDDNSPVPKITDARFIDFKLDTRISLPAALITLDNAFKSVL